MIVGMMMMVMTAPQIRKLETVGYHWKLNGKWLFLHGYGDDSIYPMFVSPPVRHAHTQTYTTGTRSACLRACVTAGCARVCGTVCVQARMSVCMCARACAC